MVRHLNDVMHCTGAHRLTLWMYLRLTSSFKTWATWSLEIFSRAERSCILHKANRSANEAVKGDGIQRSPNHGYPDGPRCVSNTETQVRVVGALVLARLHVVHDFRQPGKYVRRKILPGNCEYF